jgi:hypothetical protein
VSACAQCGREVEAKFRFCPWCGAVLRYKLVEFFRPHPNSAGRALRVSRYVGEDPQVRFSVWEDGVARAAVSLDEDETQRLLSFLGGGPRRSARSQLTSRLHALERRLQAREPQV